MFLYKNVPRKKVHSRKCTGTKDVYNHAKRGQLILKTPIAIFKIQIHKKVFFIKRSLTWPHFYKTFSWFFFVLRIYLLQDFISCDLISWDFIGSLHTILGKKSQNTGFYLLWHFFQRLEKIRTFILQVFISGFFPETFFSRYFYT